MRFQSSPGERSSVASVPFYAAHAVAFSAPFFPFAIEHVVACFAAYVVRMWAVTAGYHRYFSHRTFRTSRAFQFVLAFLAETSAQKGVLWWAANHRHHHRYSDRPEDVHSPVQRGFWWSHVGWILSGEHDRVRTEYVKDLLKYPELVWLERHHLVPPVALAIAMFALGGWPMLLWGFFVSTVLLWHGTFTINSLSHVWGKRRFDTDDDSRNNAVLALITLGEGWHNNHHKSPAAARQGLRLRELDPTYWSLKLLEKLGVVWQVREPPQSVRAAAFARPKVRRRVRATASVES